MQCSGARDLIAEHVDGRLKGADREGLLAHLEGCGECRRQYEVQAAAWKLLLEYPKIEADLVPALRRRISSPVGRVLRWAAPIAAAAAVLLATFLIARSPGPEIDPAIQAEIQKLSPEDRQLLLDLSDEEERELAENLELIRSLEVLGADHVAGRRYPMDPQ